MEDTIVKKLGYVRTSTADQANGVQAQIDAILRHDPDLDHRDIYVEQLSGALHHTKRPKLHALLDQLQPGDVVYAHKIDRIGRSTLDLLTIVERIKQNQARLVTISDGIDTGTGMVAEIFLSVLGAVAAYERALISERTKNSLKVLQDRGVQLGRPRKITPTIVRQVQTLHGDPSVSVNDVCSSLGISRTSYYAALRQPSC